MSSEHAMVWFIVTTVLFFALLIVGTFAASRSYEKARGPIHLWHRHG